MNISGSVWNIQKTQIALEHNTKTKGDMVRNSKQLMQWWAFLAGNWELESDVFISPVKEGLLQGMKISVKRHLTLFRVSWMVQDQDQSLHYWPLLAELWHHPITEHQNFFFPAFESAYFQELMMFSDKSFPTCLLAFVCNRKNNSSG